jgi:hypothetical protein
LAARTSTPLRELVASTYLDAIAFVHTLLTFYTVSCHPTTLFQAVNQPSFWVHSQYALELVLNGFGVVKSYWNPLQHPAPELIAHHALAIVLLVTSYAVRYFNGGILLLTLTNSTNLFFDFFKYGIHTNDPTLRFASSVVFWVFFGLYRIYLYSQTLLVPFAQQFTWRFPMLVFAPLLYSLFGFQCWWFYRLTHHTLRTARQWLASLRSIGNEENDFLELLESLKTTESTIQSHLLADANTESGSDSESTIEETEPAPSSSTDWNTLQERCAQLLNDHTITELSEMADKIMDEALGQWRSIMLKQLDSLDKKDKDV